ncbi:hypothetical protein Mycsm_01802 [Mycobacterium sp. JS623]|uniref:hypothetical protein n=1 Tax=Mycobacterium sp. JS623 TaxID=212767 RepID=UPI0002A5B824|nr:hypothetical protein [Mycobacterium sp. JS623]AGB22190.1 hypothetical protein Mycsm_01802 [Mycobacterium sp. JS623]
MTVDADTSEQAPLHDRDADAEHGADAAAAETVDGDDHADGDRDEPGQRPPVRGLGLRAAFAFGVITVVTLAGVCGWLGLNLSQSHHNQQQVAQFIQTARQAAVNLTTINHTSADHDVVRILDSTTGAFHDDFQNRSQQFIAVVKQAQTDTVGTVTAAGLESLQGDTAQVLVAVSVKTSNAGAAEQQPRLWRMRIDVADAGPGVKISNVQFVP